jgi:2-C-methyl-D-erythritol 4-phosphate cytidylyltransferase/2-C-methyl-D-erythritol 2,4-cyclodiphosphate synthase
MLYWLVMPAAGSGRRFGGEPKQYQRLLDRTLIEWSLAPFLADPRCVGIVIALAAGDTRFADLRCAGDPRVRTVIGGTERADSVRAAIEVLPANEETWVLVHDAARPCLSSAEIDALLVVATQSQSGALLATPVADTLKRVATLGDASPAVAQTSSREGLWRALTPQAFPSPLLHRALAAAAAAGRQPTDEAQAVEWLGLAPRLVVGSARNIKVTQPGDLSLAAAILGKPQEPVMSLRIGNGFDVHAFGPGDHVMLGGVRVPHSMGVIAHSDGDVLLHALCDAMLGAGALGDIGVHFPDSDPRWHGAASGRFVAACRTLLAERGLAVINADLTLICEAPRLGAHREAIRRQIAVLLKLPIEQVNLKATTTEKQGFTGRGEGLAAQASVLCGPVLLWRDRAQLPADHGGLPQ